MIAQRTYQVGIYARLSRDDERFGESVSIENQKLMLTQYCEQQGWTIADYYVDDGWTGTNFNRPDFQRLIDDVQNKQINLVIVKDLSRLGRDYIEVGRYTDCVFPYYDCRFIALNDGVDTLRQNDDVSMIIKNVFNDIYARDTSKKIRAVRKSNAESGKFMGQKAPYGYQKSAQDKHKLEIDPVAAAVVQRIFSLRRGGNGYQMIARILNQEGVMPPYDYHFSSRGEANPYPTNHLWSRETVKSIIRNEAYIGNMVQLKQGSISYKDHRQKNKPKENWVHVENTHDPIIDMDTWEAVRAMDGGGFKPRVTNTGVVGLFSGFLRCADGGYGMKRNVSHKTRSGGVVTAYISYLCINYNQSGKVACSSHAISEEPLKAVVLHDIQEKIAMIDIDEASMIKAIQSQRSKISKDAYQLQLSERTNLEKRLGELARLIQALYEDKVSGEVPPSVYAKLMPRYEAETQEKEARLKEVTAELSAVQEITSEAEDWVARMKQYRDVKELSRELLANLIDKIEIGESHIVDGQKQREIRIHYKFVGWIG